MSELTSNYIIFDVIITIMVVYSVILFPVISPLMVLFMWYMGREFGLKERDK